MTRFPLRIESRNGVDRAVPIGQLWESADYLRSVRAWLIHADGAAVFDGLHGGFEIGYNATALLGVLQHASVWSGDEDDREFVSLVKARDALFERRPRLTRLIADASFQQTWDRSSNVRCRRVVQGYIAANVIDQLDERYRGLGEQVRQGLQQVVGGLHDLLSAVTAHENRLKIDFGSRADDAAGRLMQVGILAAGSGPRAEIKIPVSVTRKDIEVLCEMILAAWNATVPTVAFIDLRDATAQYQFAERLLQAKWQANGHSSMDGLETLEFIRQQLPADVLGNARLYSVSPANWSRFRDSIAKLQREVYEPVRQTPIEKFDKLIRDPGGLGLVLEIDRTIVGIAFAGPLELFPDERGTLEDPFRGEPGILYVLDVTVSPEYRGELGRVLKQGLTLLAVERGATAIHGRNRDRLAGAMWAINLGLGSYELRHLPNDYPDNEAFRDCIYYRCPLSLGVDRLKIPELDTIDLKHLARLVNS